MKPWAWLAAIISAAAMHSEAILRRKDGLFILAAFMQPFVATNAPREPQQSQPDLFSSWNMKERKLTHSGHLFSPNAKNPHQLILTFKELKPKFWQKYCLKIPRSQKVAQMNGNKSLQHKGRGKLSFFDASKQCLVTMETAWLPNNSCWISDIWRDKSKMSWNLPTWNLFVKQTALAPPC